MNACKLAADRLCEGVAIGGEFGIANDAAALRRAGNEALDRERPADQLVVGRDSDRLGDRGAGLVRGLNATELGDAVKAEVEASGGVGAQHPAMRASARAAVNRDVDAPVFLHRAAGEQLGGGDARAVCADLLRKPRLKDFEPALIERAGAAGILLCGHVIPSKTGRNFRARCS